MTDTPAILDPLVRGDRVCMADDHDRQGVLDGWFHKHIVQRVTNELPDGTIYTFPTETIKAAIVVNWDDGTASTHDRAELRLVRHMDRGWE